VNDDAREPEPPPADPDAPTEAAEPSDPPAPRSRRTTIPGFPAVQAPRPRRQSQNLKRRLSAFLRSAESRAAKSTRKRVRVSLYIVRLAVQVVKQWARDRCPQQAASLAFQTVLSIVPVLAVCLAALRLTGLMEEESALVHFLSDRFIPVSSKELASLLTGLSENVTFKSVGIIGLITTVTIAFVMWHSLDQIINHIWRAERKRTIAQKFVVFYATFTIGPLLLGISLYQAARFGLAEGSSGFLLSVGSSFLALFLANWFLPSTRVRVGPAAIGAAITTVLFEIAKYIFTIYVTEFAFQRYSGIYGALAVAPFWLIWIYWSWLMLLLGAEVAHAAQNIRLLEQSERRGTLSLENELLQRVNGPMAARVMVAIVEAYLGGDKVLSRQKIADRLDLSPDVVERITRRLKDADLVIEVEGDHIGFVPARPPSEISLAQVLAAFRGDDRDGESGRQTPLTQVLADIELGTFLRTAQITLDQLVDPGR
jgi:membrane protein